MKSLLALLPLLLFANSVNAARPVDGVSFQTLQAGGTDIDVVTVDLRKAQIGLFWRDDSGARLLRLEAVREVLRKRGRQAVAITNAGIFAPETPSGLHIENGRVLHGLNLHATDGNFGMKPNGVFFIDGAGAAILEAGAFARRGSGGVRLATQSGPLLLDQGKVHPKFAPASKNALLRSGVGVVSKDRVVIAITRGAIRFYDFAVFFRDRLKCENALYLDGVISQLWAPTLGLGDDGGDFMGMLAVSVPAPGKASK